jgi:sec-independent protein translocase protein TatB
VFGISFTELVVIAIVTLLVVGPQKLPRMLRTLGDWVAKLRRMTTQVRAQTGIDEILRQEGIDGGIAELRSILRGDLGATLRGPGMRNREAVEDPYRTVEDDRLREYPPEGPDAYGALPDDLVEPAADEPSTAIAAEEPAASSEAEPRA